MKLKYPERKGMEKAEYYEARFVIRLARALIETGNQARLETELEQDRRPWFVAFIQEQMKGGQQ